MRKKELIEKRLQLLERWVPEIADKIVDLYEKVKEIKETETMIVDPINELLKDKKGRIKK